MALSGRERNLVITAGLVTVTIAVYSLVHTPLAARRAEASQALTKVQSELRREQSRVGQTGDLSLRMTQLAAREQMMDAWVPGKHAAGMFVYHLAVAERMSGTRIRGIKLVERKELAPAPKAAEEEGAEKAEAPVSLTVIRLGVEVDGPFAGQLLFNQALEDMPLFLNTDSMELKRPTLATGEPLKMAQDGYFWEAVRALGISPTLGGSYTVNVYFKHDKSGPDAAGAAFSSTAGRTDPFALDGVEEFMRELLRLYPATPGAEQQPGSELPKPLKQPVPQLG